MALDKFGSFITKGPIFSVLQCRGSVSHRQALASKQGVICYAEAHLNSHTDPKPQYAMVIAPKAMPKNAIRLAESFLEKVSKEFDIPNGGIVRGVRGSGCVQYVKWPTPSILLEPGFISNPEFAEVLQTGEGQEFLGKCLADAIIETFPGGGLVGLSIGHAYRGTGDKGANLTGTGWDPAFDQEAELCEAYIDFATEYLTRHGAEPEAPATEREPEA